MERRVDPERNKKRSMWDPWLFSFGLREGIRGERFSPGRGSLKGRIHFQFLQDK